MGDELEYQEHFMEEKNPHGNPYLNDLIAPHTGVQFQTLHFRHHCAKTSMLTCRQTEQKRHHITLHGPFILFVPLKTSWYSASEPHLSAVYSTEDLIRTHKW